MGEADRGEYREFGLDLVHSLGFLWTIQVEMSSKQLRGVGAELGRKVWAGNGVLTVIRKQWGGGRKEEGDGRWEGPRNSTLRVPLFCMHWNAGPGSCSLNQQTQPNDQHIKIAT